ncbi:Uma2 family endonuclease [Streptomyces sp. NPDC021096]|uniref:Uma2 family endonuclease n=1 Tax=Streptomyces sp. NPDC021096 TaxID=3154792 RepID=UPI0033E174A3
MSMLVEEFEEIALKAPETVWLEFINGRLEVKPPHDGNHGETLMHLTMCCREQRPGLWLYPLRGLKTEAGRQGRVRPDGVLAPVEHFVGHGEWSDPDGVLMTVEITPRGLGDDLSGLRRKRDGYAAAGIPVHVRIDRGKLGVVVYSMPKGGEYRMRRSWDMGEVVEIPAPVGITLDAEKLKEFADRTAG